MAQITIKQTNRESKCRNCGGYIDKQEPKLVVDGYRLYKTVHIGCIQLEEPIDEKIEALRELIQVNLNDRK